MAIWSEWRLPITISTVSGTVGWMKALLRVASIQKLVVRRRTVPFLLTALAG
jgi:hypothetical protein